MITTTTLDVKYLLNLLSKTLLFYFAYLPLFVLLIVQNSDFSITMFSFLFILIVGGYAAVRILLAYVNKIAPREEEIKIIAEKNTEVLNFIVTYILPLCLPLVNTNGNLISNNIISLLILFLLIYYLYIDTSLFCINPLLKIIFGYNVYEVEIDNNNYFLLSKNKHSRKLKLIQVKKLTSNLLIEESD